MQINVFIIYNFLPFILRYRISSIISPSISMFS
jgi:hypothetical protein